MKQLDTSSQPTSKHTGNDMISRFIRVSIIGLGIVFFVALIAWLIINEKSASLDLDFNFYALLSAASFVSNLVAFILISRIKERTDVLLWFSIFLLGLMAWAAAETMMRLSASPAGAVFWAPLTMFGPILMPISLYMFALAYTDSKRSLNPFLFPLLIGVSVLLMFIDAHSQLLSIYDVTSMVASPWGFVTATGPAWYLFVLWIFLMTSAALLLLVRFRRHTIEPTLRRQTKLFVIALAIPLIGGIITDGVLPVFNVVFLPPVAVILLTITGIIISYGIRKHRFFSFTPGLIASEILSTMNEAVIGITPDYHLSYANAGTERLLGLSAKELINRKFHDLLAEKWTTSQLKQKLFEHLDHQNFYTLDSVDFRVADGTTITTKLSITKVVGEGQPYGYLVVLTDITDIAQTQALIEQKVVERTHQLHEEQARLWSSIESLKLGFVLADSSGNIIVQNKALGTIFNLSAQATSIGQLQKHLTDIDLEAKSLQVRESGESISVNEVGLDSKILQIFIGPVNVDEKGQTRVIGTVLLVEDITEAKIIERSKDEFFSIASHELRTPLTSIKGNSSMILDFYKDVLKDPQLKEMVEDVHTSAARLINIVNDFLDMSRLEQGKMTFKTDDFELDKLIEGVVYEMGVTLKEKKLYLKHTLHTLGELPLIRSDADKVKQVMYNLVGNAIKFTETGGITIDAVPTKDFVKVTVADTGRGLDKEAQTLLFRKFQQTGASLLTRDTVRGTGLGLYISKMFVERMGGELKLEHSEAGKGSTFSFTLPIAKAKQHGSTPMPKSVTDTTTGLTTTEPASTTQP